MILEFKDLILGGVYIFSNYTGTRQYLGRVKSFASNRTIITTSYAPCNRKGPLRQRIVKGGDFSSNIYTAKLPSNEEKEDYKKADPYEAQKPAYELKKGDKVKYVTHTGITTCYTIGEILTVTTPPSGDLMHCVNVDNLSQSFYTSQASLVERVEVGNHLKKFPLSGWCKDAGAKLGKFLAIECDAIYEPPGYAGYAWNNGSYWSIKGDSSMTTYSWAELQEFIPATPIQEEEEEEEKEEKPKKTHKYKVGDVLEVTHKLWGHGFSIGDIITVIAVEGSPSLSSAPYHCNTVNHKQPLWWLGDAEVQLPATTLLSIYPRAPQRKVNRKSLALGDKVRVCRLDNSNAYIAMNAMVGRTFTLKEFKVEDSYVWIQGWRFSMLDLEFISKDKLEFPVWSNVLYKTPPHKVVEYPELEGYVGEIVDKGNLNFVSVAFMHLGSQGSIRYCVSRDSLTLADSPVTNGRKDLRLRKALAKDCVEPIEPTIVVGLKDRIVKVSKINSKINSKKVKRNDGLIVPLETIKNRI